jgi:O-acetyl-ADP-ribose deacetylase
MIEVIEGDITKLEVDAIANAANTQLQHGGGVAGAISRAGGPEVQRESDERAPIGLGEAVETSAGEMPARWVIHAATMELGGPTSAEIIRQATASTLKRADELGAKSLALVAFGTGVGGFPPRRGGPHRGRGGAPPPGGRQRAGAGGVRGSRRGGARGVRGRGRRELGRLGAFLSHIEKKAPDSGVQPVASSRSSASHTASSWSSKLSARAIRPSSTLITLENSRSSTSSVRRLRPRTRTRATT